MARFEWHDKKNDSNQEKHGLLFEDASQVFDDPDRIQYMSTRGNEKRFLTVGKVIKFIVAVVYTVRSGVLRIISARQAKRREVKDYLENKLKKQDDERE